MFMKIGKEISINEVEKGYEVMLFDNRKGGKDHGIKLVTDIEKTFLRIRRRGFVIAGNKPPMGVNADVAYSQFHEVPHAITGYKIEDVKIKLEPGSHGKMGTVSATIRPFGPKYLELLQAIQSNDEMNFQLCYTEDKSNHVFRVLHVAYKPREASMTL